MWGAAVAAGGLCLAHLRPEQREAYLAALAPGADIDARGVTFTRELLRQLQAALIDGITRGARCGAADFSDAAFAENVNFHGATFSASTDFSGAALSAYAGYDGPASPATG